MCGQSRPDIRQMEKRIYALSGEGEDLLRVIRLCTDEKNLKQELPSLLLRLKRLRARYQSILTEVEAELSGETEKSPFFLQMKTSILQETGWLNEMEKTLESARSGAELSDRMEKEMLEKRFMSSITGGEK